MSPKGQGKRPAAICDICNAKMNRLYAKINNSFKGVGYACKNELCGHHYLDSQTAMAKAWAVLKKGGN